MMVTISHPPIVRLAGDIISYLGNHYYVAAMLWPRRPETKVMQKNTGSAHLLCYDSTGLQRIAKDILRVLKNVLMYLETCLLMMCTTRDTDFYEWIITEFFSLECIVNKMSYCLFYFHPYLSRGYSVQDFIRRHKSNTTLITWLTDNAITEPIEQWQLPITSKVTDRELVRGPDPVTAQDLGAAIRTFNRDYIRWAFLEHKVEIYRDRDRAKNFWWNVCNVGDMATILLAIETGYIDVRLILDCLTIESQNPDISPCWAYKLDMVLDYIHGISPRLSYHDFSTYYLLDSEVEFHNHIRRRFEVPTYPGFIGDIFSPLLERIQISIFRKINQKYNDTTRRR